MPIQVSSRDRDTLSRYFFGQLPQAEEEQVEARFMADAMYFELYREVERALMRDYAAGEMEPADAVLFEQNYLVTAERRRQVVIFRELLTIQGVREVSITAPPLIWRRLILVPVLAVTVFAAALVWYWERPPRAVSTVASVPQAQPRPTNRKPTESGSFSSKASEQAPKVVRNHPTGEPKRTGAKVPKTSGSPVLPSESGPTSAESHPALSSQDQPGTSAAPVTASATSGAVESAARPSQTGATFTSPGGGGGTARGRGGRPIQPFIAMAPAPRTSGRAAYAPRSQTPSRPVPGGARVIPTPARPAISLRADGRPAEIRTNNGTEIHHGLTGNRSAMIRRPDGSRVFAENGGHGYVEHPFRYGNREFALRSYYYNGRSYGRYYGRYAFRGVSLSYYSPAYYYRPAFYGWAYNPWPAPVSYNWGWAGNPWYGYYGSYFTPYPIYPSAPLWLTDYLISASLTAGYQAQVTAAVNASALPPDEAPLTPQVKDLIAAEVQRQIALENAEAQTAQSGAADPASSSIVRMLADSTQHVFVVGHDLDVVDASGRECVVSPGDAIQLAGPTSPDATAANLVVLSSKGGPECRRNSTIMVQFADLQEMQNHMRETIDDGMAELQAKQVSPIPQSAVGPAVQASFVAAAPPTDPNAAAEINQQMQEADQAEKEVLAETQSATAAKPPAIAVSVAPVELKLGQTVDEVTAIFGPPTTIVVAGAQEICVYKSTYKGMKATFKDGRLVDIN